MYSRIQALKEQGFSIRQASRIIRVSRNTISKYWEMDPETYANTYKSVNRMTALKAFEPIILRWLETYPCMTAAQVRDWLEEHHQLDASDRTVRRLVAQMRKDYGISKETEPKREYEAVDEQPMGYQLQLDFGEKSVRYSHSSRYVKLYFVVFTLSHSRYKWGVFQERPFLSADLVSALYGCFEYLGGMPRQLVYDQDSILVVSENAGDIIHTKAFATFLAESKLEVRVCRKADPESKGLVEASVKFVKGNFMENRLYMGIDIWNRSFEDWLERTGNKKKHGTTKQRPVDKFVEEQEHLLPLYGVTPAAIAEEMNRNVRPDNTVWYLSNRYSVPYGTYSGTKDVFLVIEDDKLKIIDGVGDEIAVHDIYKGKGKLIKLDSHRRKKREKIEERRENAIALLGEDFREYIEILCEKKPRYVKDQLDIIVTACKTYGRDSVLGAIQYCVGLELYSANDFRDATEMLFRDEVSEINLNGLPVNDERYHIPVQKRALTVYSDVATGSGVS